MKRMASRIASDETGTISRWNLAKPEAKSSTLKRSTGRRLLSRSCISSLETSIGKPFMEPDTSTMKR